MHSRRSTRSGSSRQGTPMSPEAAMASPELAHYYQFEQVVENHMFIQKGGHWVESPNPIPPIPLLRTLSDGPDPRGGYQNLAADVSAAMQAFNDPYREMLVNLKQAWALGGADGQGALGLRDRPDGRPKRRDRPEDPGRHDFPIQDRQWPGRLRPEFPGVNRTREVASVSDEVFRPGASL